MFDLNVPPEESAVQVEGIYLDPYEAIVQPDLLFLVPNYFIAHWLQRLGPTLSWVVVALQQACWRANGQSCTISQSAIADEVGIERHTISRVINDNDWAQWYVPEVEFQPGSTDRRGIYYPSPKKYTVYRLPPLAPDHLAGLLVHFRDAYNGQVTSIEAGIDQLLALGSKEALKLLERAAPDTSVRFDRPHTAREVIELATGVRFDTLPPAAAKTLNRKAASLKSHLTNIGHTVCRQYFRLNWVPRLGPTMSWLVMILRSHCYYNPETDELRDVYTWSKKELMAWLGQTTDNLRKSLLPHPFADHFFQVTENRKRTITFRVAMIDEPLTTESAAAYWQRQPKKEEISTMTPPANPEISTITPSTKAEISTNNASQPGKNYHQPALKPEFSAISKYFKQSVPEFVVENRAQQADLEPVEHDDLARQALLRGAGLSGPGLRKLLRGRPALELPYLKAVILYAAAQGLGSGYIYRHLEQRDPIAAQFLRFAALDETTLNLFFRGVAEIRHGGRLRLTIETPIPAENARLFGDFAAAFTGVEAEEVTAALRRDSAANICLPQTDISHNHDGELEIVWDRVLAQLRLQMAQSTFDSWLSASSLLEQRGRHFVIAVNNRYARAWLERRLGGLIRQVIAQVLACGPAADITLEFVVRENEMPKASE